MYKQREPEMRTCTIGSIAVNAGTFSVGWVGLEWTESTPYLQLASCPLCYKLSVLGSSCSMSSTSSSTPSSTCCSLRLTNPNPPLTAVKLGSPIIRVRCGVTRFQLMVPIMSKRPPNFKVVKERQKRCCTSCILYIYGIQGDWMQKITRNTKKINIADYIIYRAQKSPKFAKS